MWCKPQDCLNLKQLARWWPADFTCELTIPVIHSVSMRKRNSLIRSALRSWHCTIALHGCRCVMYFVRESEAHIACG